MGYSQDPRKNKVEAFKSMSFQDIMKFYTSSVDTSTYGIVVVADLSRIDMDKLATFGRVVKLTKSDVFN